MPLRALRLQHLMWTSAFRCCPITPSQQQNFVIRWNSLCYINIDYNAPSSTTSVGGVFSRVADAKSVILKLKKIGPSKNWVDDFVFFRLPITLDPTPIFSYSLMDIYLSEIALDGHGRDLKLDPFSAEFK